jgi:hypothetical protein
VCASACLCVTQSCDWDIGRVLLRKNFYRLPFTPPLSGSPFRSFRGTTCSVRNGADGRDGLVAGWLKISRRDNKER